MKKSTGLAVLGFGVLFATMLGVQVSMSTAPGGYGVAHAQGQAQQQSGQRAGQARPVGQAQQARVPEYDVRPHRDRCHPLEGPLSTLDTSPFRELLGSGWSGSGKDKLLGGGCAPVVSCVRYGDPHQPPIGIKVLEPGTGSSTPGTVLCPQKIFGSRSCPRLEDSRSELPRRTGRQHVVARDLGASPAKSKKARGRGSIRR
jgi:hypothetical protein